MLEAYSGGELFRNIPGSMVWEIKFLGMEADKKGGVETARSSERCKYLAVAFLIILDRRQYRKFILDLKNDFANQQKNYPKILTDMYDLMVAFEPTGVMPVARGHNEGINFVRTATKNEDKGGGDVGRGGGGAGVKR